jgi:hypothetical protein
LALVSKVTKDTILGETAVPHHFNRHRSLYHNSTWQAFFEESKLVYRMTFLLEFFLDYLRLTIKLDMALIHRLGMSKAVEVACS